MIFNAKNAKQFNKFYLESHTNGSNFSNMLDNKLTFVC